MIAPLVRFRDNQQVSGRDLNMVIDKLNRTVIQGVTGGRLVRTGSGAHIVWPSVQTGTLRRAKTQEAGQSDGKISCKLLDAEDVESGDAFDVFMLPSAATVTLSTTYPQIANTADVLIMKDVDGDWYLVNPSLSSVSSITVQTDTSVNGSSKLLQKKTRANVKVFATDSESGVTTVHTGETCS